MHKKGYTKKIVVVSRNAQFKAIPPFFRIPLIFLANIGDAVIFLLGRILFVLNKAFSISTHILSQLVLFGGEVKKYILYKITRPFSSSTSIKSNEGLIFSRSSKAHPLASQFFKWLVSSYLHFFALRSSIKNGFRIVKKLFDFSKILIYKIIVLLHSLRRTAIKPKLWVRHKVTSAVRTSRKKITLPRAHLHLPHPPPLFLGIVLGAFLVFFFVFIPYSIYSYLRLLPNPRLLSQRVIPVTSQIFDRSGNLLYEIHGDEDRKPLKLADIPDTLKHATIAIEDRDFYHHFGFSITGIARAARETFIAGNTQGGSTITQQLVKTALLTPEVTLSRKVKELVLAFWAERIYSKAQILEMYLNQVPYGGTAWGVEAAAQTYFGKSVKDLTLAEAAYLAGLPAAPSLYSPYGAHPEYAKLRQKEVLNRMLDDRYITKEQFDGAISTDLPVKPDLVNIKAPHFVMYVRELLTQKYGPLLVDRGGLRITTTLDLPLQEKVQQLVSKNVADLARLNVGNGAAVVTSPQNGDILAMIGSIDYFDLSRDGNVNVTLSPRQPGSSIKPIMYAAALEKGLTAASLIEDTPVAFTSVGSPTYAPVNYDGRFHGTVTLRTALGNSYNIPAVKTLNRIGVKSLLDMGKQMGITTWTDESRYGLALTLGGGETTLTDMVTAYGVLANGGKRVNLDPILKVTDYTGRVYYEKGQPAANQVISPATAFILSDILADNSARTAAFGPNSQLVIPGKTVSVKTGTTNDKRDNLTFGYTPSFVVGVWVGNNDNTPMNPVLTSGVTGAAPIWNQIMSELLKNKPNEPMLRPGNIITISCFGRTEYFAEGTQPKNGCGHLPSPAPSLFPQAI